MSACGVRASTSGVFDETGWTPPPEVMPYEGWEQIGPELVKARDATNWRLGDWLLYGDHAYGEKYAQATARLQLDESHLKNCQWVARRFPRGLSARTFERGRLRWSMYLLVAGQDEETATSLLTLAEHSRWSYRDLQATLRQLKQGAEAEGQPEERTPFCGADRSTTAANTRRSSVLTNILANKPHALDRLEAEGPGTEPGDSVEHLVAGMTYGEVSSLAEQFEHDARVLMEKAARLRDYAERELKDASSPNLIRESSPDDHLPQLPQARSMPDDSVQGRGSSGPADFPELPSFLDRRGPVADPQVQVALVPPAPPGRTPTKPQPQGPPRFRLSA